MAGKPVESELSRDLTLFHITMMGLGMMIGAGVFLGIGNAVYVAGPGGALLTFLLNGIIAMFTALSYAELSSAVPRAGGAYNYARIGFGQGTSFVAGFRVKAPVTRRPPHRSGREVLPHPVPRCYPFLRIGTTQATPRVAHNFAAPGVRYCERFAASTTDTCPAGPQT